VRLLVAGLVVLALAALGAQSARADGDPASDVLVVQNVFLPFAAQLPKPLDRALTRATAQAKKAGYPIRVALITQPADLGAVPSLFGKPQTYAKFLGEELSFVYSGRVLVVMPKGFGVYNGRAPVTAEERVLAKIPVGPGLDGMAGSAVNAVAALAAAAGHRLNVPQIHTFTDAKSSSSSNDDRLIIGAAVGGLALLAAAAYAVRRRRHA
jgi:MYXO-CTERM domain-containing protein